MKQLTDIQKERLRKAIKYLVVSIATAIAMALGLTSCSEHVGQRSLTATNISCYCYMHNLSPLAPKDVDLGASCLCCL